MAERITLSELINRGETVAGTPATYTAVESAIVAAYWAGQEQMRARLAGMIHDRLARFTPFTRYRRAERRAVQRVVGGIDLLGGEGRSDAPELLAWDYTLPTATDAGVARV